MSLSAAQAAIVATLTELLDVPVRAHGGMFAERELPLLLGQAPVVLVASTGVADYRPYAPDAWQGVVGWAAYCLAADGVTARAERAMALAQVILDQMIDQTWGLAETACEPPDFTTVRADNLYSGHVNNLRVALWTVSWQQTLTFPFGETA